MEGMFGFGCAINARRRSFISKNWNFQMHFDTEAMSFQRRKCASSLTLCLWDFPKYLFLWGKKNMRNRVLHKFSTCNLCVTSEGYQSKRQIPEMHFHIENREEFLFLSESIKYMEKCTNGWYTNRSKNVPFF